MITILFQFIKSPLFKYLAVFLVIVGVLFGAYKKGGDVVRAEWDLEKAKTALEIAALKAKSTESTTVTETKYVEKIKYVKLKGETVTKFVDRAIPASANAACILPVSFIAVHDHAARNIELKLSPTLTGTPK